jgi:uncharacterized protein YjbJ (UPF0337 family)
MALNTQALQGQWNQINGRLHERWGALRDDELEQAKGNIEHLVGTIQEQTGETREAIRGFLEQLVSDSESAMGRTAAAVRGFASDASEKVQDAAQRASESVRVGMQGGEQMIRQHPIESVLACFGAGIVTGVILGLYFRSN